jgi:hypothetical protein
MKSFVLLLLISASAYVANAQTTTANTNEQTRADTFQIVEAACGQCKFGIKGEDCNLAVRINGQAYFVDGTKIDDHGDAHADDGFCNKIRKATVSGSVVNNRFLATSFKLLPEEKQKQ